MSQTLTSSATDSIATDSSVTDSIATDSVDDAATAGATEADRATDRTAAGRPGAAFAPLAVDVLAPLGGYFLLHSALGLGQVAALGLAGVIPAARTALGLLRDRRLNTWAALMLAVNLVGLALAGVTGDARLMIAKDGLLSGAVGLAVLVSVAAGRPLMSGVLMPFLTKGDRLRSAAWERLAGGRAAGSRAFRRYERLFSSVWGLALFGECVARVVGAFTLPVSTMAWLSTVLLVGAIVLAALLGRAAADPMEKLVRAEAATGSAATAA
ncbi:VC0807 family protein [Kitasatospora sp. NPDC057015]|uniref:VC0807 family protein n=1 Tax=Kitasatospora sp. NPDC057015 TaxID=3346001 RepID=UPI00363D39EA